MWGKLCSHCACLISIFEYRSKPTHGTKADKANKRAACAGDVPDAWPGTVPNKGRKQDADEASSVAGSQLTGPMSTYINVRRDANCVAATAFNYEGV